MLEFIVAHLFMTALKFFLKPFILFPSAGIIFAFYFPGLRLKLFAAGLLILTGLFVSAAEYVIEPIRSDFLEKRMSVTYGAFPRQSAGVDVALYALTFIPSFLLVLIIVVGGIFLLNLPLNRPFLFALFFSAAGTFLFSMSHCVIVPSFSPNGSPPIPEKLFPIHAAAKEGNVQELKNLMEQGLDVNRMTNYRMAPLHHAVEQNHFEAADLLIRSGADINSYGGNFIPKTPLFLAALNGSREITELLLKHGADIQAKSNNRNNILYYAQEHYELFTLFVEKGADLKNINQYDESLLSIAAGMEQNFLPHPGALRLTKFLLQKGLQADGIPGESGSPLLRACYAGNIAVAELLLNSGANPNRTDQFERTALYAAVETLNLPLVRMLLEKGADSHKPSGTLHGQKKETVSEKILKILDFYNTDEQLEKIRIIQELLKGR